MKKIYIISVHYTNTNLELSKPHCVFVCPLDKKTDILHIELFRYI